MYISSTPQQFNRLAYRNQAMSNFYKVNLKSLRKLKRKRKKKGYSEIKNSKPLEILSRFIFYPQSKENNVILCWSFWKKVACIKFSQTNHKTCRPVILKDLILITDREQVTNIKQTKSYKQIIFRPKWKLFFFAIWPSKDFFWVPNVLFLSIFL